MHRDGTSLLVASTGLFGQERGGAGLMAVPPGVNAFWSAGVQRELQFLEQVADVARPDSLPPLAGAPVTFGPAGYGGAGHGSFLVRALGRLLAVVLVLSRPLVQELFMGVLSRPWVQELYMGVLCRPVVLELYMEALGRPVVQELYMGVLSRPKGR